MLNKILPSLALSFSAFAMSQAAYAETTPIAPAGVTADQDLREGNVSQQGALIAHYAVNQLGQQNALIMDKKSATLHIVQNGQIIYSMPAIFGKGEGDIAPVSSNVTNAGIFSLTPLFTPGNELGDEMILFNCKGNDCDVIHETSGKLAPRLDVIADGNILNNSGEKFGSNGCLGLTEADMKVVFNFIAEMYKKGENVLLLVANENSDINTTAEFFGMSKDTLDGFSESLRQSYKPVVRAIAP